MSIAFSTKQHGDWQDYLVWCKSLKNISEIGGYVLDVFSDDLIESFMDGLSPQEAYNYFSKEKK